VARKLLFLAHREILKKWTMPIYNWALILNQLVIRFEDRMLSTSDEIVHKRPV
jgi:hypothetical protein